MNVGAGTGSYEPTDRRVVAVEPSATMIRQRSLDAAPVVRAVAEHLPLPSDSFDAAMALMTIHHWTDWRAGLRELCRLAPRRVVWTFHPAFNERFWLMRDYFPASMRTPAVTDVPSVGDVAAAIDATRVEVVMVPADCVDLFGWASWRRPERYLDDGVCRATSVLAQLSGDDLREGQRRLADDLRSGLWHSRYHYLLELDAVDAGFRLVICD
ncbi:MAG: class I SAM-dependent methyltransferase [Acidimicrobiales bacterium]